LEQKKKDIIAVQNVGPDIQRSLSEKTNQIEQIQSKLGDFERLEAELDDSKQKKADQIFLEAMTDLDVISWKKQFMYYAVKFCGFFAWAKHRNSK